MYITWLGHACFKIQEKINSEEVTMVTDPFNSSIGIKMPRHLEADVVTVSHGHDDHNNISAISGNPFVITTPGEYEIKKIFVYTISSYHDGDKGKERGDNLISRIEIGGLSLAHLGDLGHSLEAEQLEKLQNVDILFIPVGGVYTIGAEKAAEVVGQIEPRLVIPMHYKIPGLKINLDSVDKFCKEMGLGKTEKLPKLKIGRKDLPQDQTQVILLEKV